MGKVTFALDKIILFLLVVFYSVSGLVPSCHSARNLALGKSYTVSPPPNYGLSAPPSDTTSLTDGKYTIGHFWTQKATVGWQLKKSVEVMIDLEKIAIIDSITFSTARGEKEGGVYYPANIVAFVGPDRDHLLYVGDIGKNPENFPGSYQIKRFSLDGIGTKGRYVLLEVSLQGPFLFCDEIEVLEGNQERKNSSEILQTIEEARTTAEKLRRLGIEKKFLYEVSEKLKPVLVAEPELSRCIVEIDQRIASLESISNAESIETDILRIRAEALRGQYKQGFLIEAIDPWRTFSPVSLPSGVPLKSLSLILPQNGYDSRAIVITNLSPSPLTISVSFPEMAETAPEVSVYQVSFVKSAAMEYVADPVVPFEKSVSLRSGESGMVFINAFGKNPGIWKSILKITSGSTVVAIPVAFQVLPVVLPEKFTLNTVNWGYLNFKLLSDRKNEAVNDLFTHHTNVVVVPPMYLPIKEDPKSTDFGALVDYLKMHKGISKVLLFASLGSSDHAALAGKYPYMGDKWKVWCRRWYGEITESAFNAGFSREQLYFYPFDEPRGSHLKMLADLVAWARKDNPSMQFYATINAVESLELLPILDIAQVHDKLLPLLPAFKGSGLWLYDTKGPAKSQSSYFYYRMMPWKAFLLGLKGAGFWAYADSGSGQNPGSAWDDFDGDNPDYAVIYEGAENGIISSRRWEGWRMGVEDYELLTMYSKAKGAEAAKTLAKEIVEDNSDVSKADEARQKILSELSGLFTFGEVTK